jgi:hypothetical protein
MPAQTSYIGVNPRTVIPTAVALARGVRVTRNSSGLVAVAGIGTRGDYVTLTSCDASEPVQACPMQDAAKVPALSTEATVVGDLAYSAASGLFSKTATSAVLVGRWTQAAPGASTLGEVELFTVA